MFCSLADWQLNLVTPHTARLFATLPVKAAWAGNLFFITPVPLKIKVKNE